MSPDMMFPRKLYTPIPHMNIAAGTVHSPAGWAHFIGVIMGNSGKGVGMVTWADADAAVEAERAQRLRRVENTTLLTALSSWCALYGSHGLPSRA